MTDPLVGGRRVTRWPEEEPTDDDVAIEEPLEIRVEGEPLAVLMRSPGHDLELVVGFLLAEGVIDGADDLSALAHADADPDKNTVLVRLAAGVAAHREALLRARRSTVASAGCGVCGKRSIDAVRWAIPPVSRLELEPPQIVALPDQLRQRQGAFSRTGGLHGAALIRPDGTLVVCREDVGRHNAVDKVLGWRLLHDPQPAPAPALVVSSRAGFEIVQKAAMSGVGCVVTMGAATTLAVDLAADLGIQLIGFAARHRFVRYS